MNNTNEYEKIQLTKSDLKFLYDQVHSKLSHRLNMHLPTANSDPLKLRVIDLINEFNLEVFEMAQDALVVDGQELASATGSATTTGSKKSKAARGATNTKQLKDILQLNYDQREEIEPFNNEKNLELRGILQSLEQETIKVTRQRRELPQSVKSVYDELITRTDNEVTEILSVLEAEDVIAQEDVEEERKISIDTGRLQSIERDYEETLRRLVELKKVLPSQRAEISVLDETITFLEDLYGKGA